MTCDGPGSPRKGSRRCRAITNARAETHQRRRDHCGAPNPLGAVFNGNAIYNLLRKSFGSRMRCRRDQASEQSANIASNDGSATRISVDGIFTNDSDQGRRYSALVIALVCSERLKSGMGPQCKMVHRRSGFQQDHRSHLASDSLAGRDKNSSWTNILCH